MIWFFAEDNFWYSKENINKLKIEYKLNDIILLPSLEEIKKHILNFNFQKTAFIAPYYPEKLDKKFENSSFFEVIRLKNYYEPFTKNEIELNLDKKNILANKFGINIINANNFTFKDYVGADKLIFEAKKIELKLISGLQAKGLFLVGLPGTGKSFFVKCFAGQTNRILIELNFSKILEQERPIERLSMILKYIQNNPNKYLIWIDEIEKMFSNENSQQILGSFLTELNEFNTLKSNALFIATANNISELAKRNPELFRTGGRFDKIIALLPPTEENTLKIFSLYFNKLKNNFIENVLSAFFINYYSLDYQYYNNSNIDEISLDLKIHLKHNYDKFFKITENFEKYVNFFKNKTLSSELDESFISKLKLADNDEERFVILKDKFVQIFNHFYKTNMLFKNIFDGFVQKKYILNEQNFIFNLSQKILTKYRNFTAIQNRFPYTQAEISTFASELYTNFYFGTFDIKDAINYTINQLKPLQVQMSNEIKNMSEQIRDYLQI